MGTPWWAEVRSRGALGHNSNPKGGLWDAPNEPKMRPRRAPRGPMGTEILSLQAWGNGWSQWGPTEGYFIGCIPKIGCMPEIGRMPDIGCIPDFGLTPDIGCMPNTEGRMVWYSNIGLIWRPEWYANTCIGQLWKMAWCSNI